MAEVRWPLQAADDLEAITHFITRRRLPALRQPLRNDILAAVERLRAFPNSSGHSHPGFELAYQIQDRTLLHHGKEAWKINEGDLLYFDASLKHSVTALEPAKFLTIHFRE